WRGRRGRRWRGGRAAVGEWLSRPGLIGRRRSRIAGSGGPGAPTGLTCPAAASAGSAAISAASAAAAAARPARGRNRRGRRPEEYRVLLLVIAASLQRGAAAAGMGVADAWRVEQVDRRGHLPDRLQ